MAERPMRRDPGDPEGPCGGTGPGPVPPAGETDDAEGWEAGVDRFLAALFPPASFGPGESDVGG